jgi:hypothetical protein
MTLTLVELERTAWWQFWKRAPATRPLSTHASAVPQAELALLEALLQKSTRREKPCPRRRRPRAGPQSRFRPIRVDHECGTPGVRGQRRPEWRRRERALGRYADGVGHSKVTSTTKNQ